MEVSIKGPWSADKIAEFLGASCYPMRLSCVGSDGYPRVVSVWFIHEQGQIFCASHNASQLALMLGSNGRVGFEVATNEPPYFGVRGQGDATLASEGGAGMLKRLLDRYLGGTDSSLAQWLLSRSAQELLITITPHRLFSWDYRQRMGSGPDPL